MTAVIIITLLLYEADQTKVPVFLHSHLRLGRAFQSHTFGTCTAGFYRPEAFPVMLLHDRKCMLFLHTCSNLADS